MTRTVSPGRHRPVMALTRAIAAKLADHSPVDVSTSPGRRRHRCPSSSSSSSSSSTSTSFSTPRTPMNSITKLKDSFSCSSCVLLSSHVQNLIDVIDSKFKEFSLQFENICNRLSNVEESINDHHSIINEIERKLSIVADKLKNAPSKSSDSFSSHSGTYKLHKSTQTNHNCSSPLPLMSSRNSNSHPTLAPIVFNPPPSTVYWRPTPSTRPTVPLTTSTHHRRTVPSSPPRCSPLRNTRRSDPSIRPTIPLPTPIVLSHLPHLPLLDTPPSVIPRPVLLMLLLRMPLIPLIIIIILLL